MDKLAGPIIALEEPVMIVTIEQPPDWAEVSPTPVVGVRVSPFSEEPLVAAFVDYDKFIADQDWQEATAHTTLVLDPLSGMHCGYVEKHLDFGKKFIVVHSPRQPSKLLAISGCIVSETRHNWVTRFREDLAERMSRRPPMTNELQVESGEPPLFSITTTVYDTDVAYLIELVADVITQRYRNFEWLILDNGSKDPSVVSSLIHFARVDKRIKHYRVEENIHIIPGNRYLLERASGKYIVPIDSDDVVYPDALEQFAEKISEGTAPVAIYSDEHKIDHKSNPSEYIWRPSWSPLFSIATCPAAHLTAIDRERALAVGAYSDDYAQGSHDWDTFLRITDSGDEPVHLASVLYGWRIHKNSTAGNENAKSYIADSQLSVVKNAVDRRGLSESFEVEGAKAAMGYYHLHRRQISPPPVQIDLVLEDGSSLQKKNLISNLQNINYPSAKIRIIHFGDMKEIKEKRYGREISWLKVESDEEFAEKMQEVHALALYKIVMNCSIRLIGNENVWDAVGTFELDSRVAVVGGKILDEKEAVRHIGYVVGLDGFVNTPSPGALPEEVYGAIAFLRRNVSAVYGGLMAMRSDVLKEYGGLKGRDSDDGLYGLELSLRLRSLGYEAAYTPLLAGKRQRSIAYMVGESNPEFKAELQEKYSNILSAVDPYYSSNLEQSARNYGMVSAIDSELRDREN